MSLNGSLEAPVLRVTEVRGSPARPGGPLAGGLGLLAQPGLQSGLPDGINTAITKPSFRSSTRRAPPPRRVEVTAFISMPVFEFSF